MDKPQNTEDRQPWFKYGVMLEHRFVEACDDYLFLQAKINPEKARNPKVPDLIVDGKLADLKSQGTPFFTASKYGIDPRYAAVFNRKDFDYYHRCYPSIVIYFWIDWQISRWNDLIVEPLSGVYRAEFSLLAKMIEGGAPEHFYRNRVNDTTGNAKSSFVFDVRQFEKIHELAHCLRGIQL